MLRERWRGLLVGVSGGWVKRVSSVGVGSSSLLVVLVLVFAMVIVEVLWLSCVDAITLFCARISD